MIKGINQSIVNRSIAGGGVNCKCINGNGISGDFTGNSGNGDGNGDGNGGKITVEFTVYSFKETSGDPPTTTTNSYIKKEDADKVFKEILNIDQEKYVFYMVTYHNEQYDVNVSTVYAGVPCVTMHIKSYDDEMIPTNITAININTVDGSVHSNPFILLTINDNAIDYNLSFVFYTAIIETLPNVNVYNSTTYKLTLYYRER